MVTHEALAAKTARTAYRVVLYSVTYCREFDRMAHDETEVAAMMLTARNDTSVHFVRVEPWTNEFTPFGQES